MSTPKRPVKYIFILGGVISGLGKGILAASLGYLLKSRGVKVTIQKLDPYLNVDPGTMNPLQHVRFLFWMTAPKQTWTLGITSGSSIRICRC